MKYQLDEIPYAQFEQLGMSKKDVQSKLSFEDLDKLLSGEKTDLKTINIQTQNLSLDIDAKFSLRRNADNTINLMLHPKRQQIDTKYDLSKEDISRLEVGETVLKNSSRTDSSASLSSEKSPDVFNNYLYQMDKDTKEIMRINTVNIKIPDSIEDIKLTLDQKDKLRNGEGIELEKPDKKLNVKLDLNKPQLLKITVSDNLRIANTTKYRR
jgi:Protein of unknown function (DUF4099)/Protein of unknown function (DUF3945)